MKVCLKLEIWFFILLIISNVKNYQHQFEDQTTLKNLCDKKCRLIDNILLSLSTNKSKHCLLNDETTLNLNNLEEKLKKKILPIVNIAQNKEFSRDIYDILNGIQIIPFMNLNWLISQFRTKKVKFT